MRTILRVYFINVWTLKISVLLTLLKKFYCVYCVLSAASIVNPFLYSYKRITKVKFKVVQINGYLHLINFSFLRQNQEIYQL